MFDELKALTANRTPQMKFLEKTSFSLIRLLKVYAISANAARSKESSFHEVTRFLCKAAELEVLGWSRIPKITRSRGRIFYPTPEVQLNHFVPCTL